MESDSRAQKHRKDHLCFKHWLLLLRVSWREVRDLEMGFYPSLLPRQDALEEARSCPRCFSSSDLQPPVTAAGPALAGRASNPGAVGGGERTSFEDIMPSAGYRVGDRRTRRRPRTDLGTVIAGVAIFMIASAVIANLFHPWVGVSKAGADESFTRTAGWVDVDALVVGDCVRRMSDGSGAALDTVEVVPCSKRHAEEVDGKFSLRGVKYPGNRRVERLASRGCDKRFPGYVGLPVETSRVDEYITYPSSQNWTHGDRLVICTVAAKRVPSRGSLKNVGHVSPQ